VYCFCEEIIFALTYPVAYIALNDKKLVKAFKNNVIKYVKKVT